jgi:8-oxo-dGTP diphosphatase
MNNDYRQRYVVGVMMTPETVLLVQKNRPAFQCGKWNGIGGKVERDEMPHDAMVREFHEECGVLTEKHDWQHTVFFEGDDFDIFWYRSFVNTMPFYRTTTDEAIGEIEIKAIFRHFPRSTT